MGDDTANGAQNDINVTQGNDSNLGQDTLNSVVVKPVEDVAKPLGMGEINENGKIAINFGATKPAMPSTDGDNADSSNDNSSDEQDVMIDHSMEESSTQDQQSDLGDSEKVIDNQDGKESDLNIRKLAEDSSDSNIEKQTEIVSNSDINEQAEPMQSADVSESVEDIEQNVPNRNFSNDDQVKNGQSSPNKKREPRIKDIDGQVKKLYKRIREITSEYFDELPVLPTVSEKRVMDVKYYKQIEDAFNEIYSEVKNDEVRNALLYFVEIFPLPMRENGFHQIKAEERYIELAHSGNLKKNLAILGQAAYAAKDREALISINRLSSLAMSANQEKNRYWRFELIGLSMKMNEYAEKFSSGRRRIVSPFPMHMKMNLTNFESELECKTIESNVDQFGRVDNLRVDFRFPESEDMRFIGLYYSQDFGIKPEDN